MTQELSFTRDINHTRLVEELYSELGTRLLGMKSDPVDLMVVITVPDDIDKATAQKIRDIVDAHDPTEKASIDIAEEARQDAQRAIKSVDFEALGGVIAEMRESPEKHALELLCGAVRQIAVAQGLIVEKDERSKR